MIYKNLYKKILKKQKLIHFFIKIMEKYKIRIFKKKINMIYFKNNKNEKFLIDID